MTTKEHQLYPVSRINTAARERPLGVERPRKLAHTSWKLTKTRWVYDLMPNMQPMQQIQQIQQMQQMQQIQQMQQMQQMQDPGDGVHPHLRAHVHLVSNHKFPIFHRFDEQRAFDVLLEAPKIVSDSNSMAWQYLNCPHDGSLLLVWQPLSKGPMFSTDGYIWADIEASYRFEVHGYTMEILVHKSGYKPFVERVATHCRHRYHLLSKNPNIPGPQPDPSLWIVHYGQADPQWHVDSQRITLDHRVQLAIQQRRYLESQGNLAKRDFMFNDRANWPHINMPIGQPVPLHAQAQSGVHLNSMPQTGMGRAGPPMYNSVPSAPVGPSPAKRPRQTGPQHLNRGGNTGLGPIASAMAQEMKLLEEEENISLGDRFDNISPMEISEVRFRQHNLWMEEIFSTPYRIDQFVPVDLGLGLMGELKGLTDGILDAPSIDVPIPKDIDDQFEQLKHPKIPHYKKIHAQQLEEFESRVAKYLRMGQKEMEQMKKDHERRLGDLKRAKIFMQAERRLRDASLTSEGFGNEIWRVDMAAYPQPLGSTETTEDVVRDVESALNVKIEPRKDMVCVSKGGLIEKQAILPNPGQITSKDDSIDTSGTNGDNGIINVGFEESNLLDNGLENHNTAAGLLDELGETSFSTTPAGQNLATPQVGTPQPNPTQHTVAPTHVEQIEEPSMDDLGMDLDGSMVDISGFDDSVAEPKEKPITVAETEISDAPGQQDLRDPESTERKSTSVDLPQQTYASRGSEDPEAPAAAAVVTEPKSSEAMLAQAAPERGTESQPTQLGFEQAAADPDSGSKPPPEVEDKDLTTGAVSFDTSNNEFGAFNHTNLGAAEDALVDFDGAGVTETENEMSETAGLT